MLAGEAALDEALQRTLADARASEIAESLGDYKERCPLLCNPLSLSFGMPELGGEASVAGAAGFAFTVPADPAWADSLASITLSGPGGSVSLDADSDRPTTIIFDSVARRVRGILRHSSRDLLARGGPGNLADEVVRRLGAERDVTVLTSRGLPERHGRPRR